MPKTRTGVLIQCEKTIKMFIQMLDKKEKIILLDLDDCHLLVDEKKLLYIQEEVYKMQDKNSYEEIQIVSGPAPDFMK